MTLPARPAALVAAGQIAPQFLALASGAIDEGGDGFEPQGAQAALMAGLEPAGDLLRGPSLGEAITDEVPQPAIPFEDGVTPSAPLIGSGGVERRRAAPGQGVSAQLPRHGGLGPPPQPWRWRQSNGQPPSAQLCDLFLHPADANSLAWQHSRRS